MVEVEYNGQWVWHKLLDQPVFVFALLGEGIKWIAYVAREGQVQHGEEDNCENLVRINKEELEF